MLYLKGNNIIDIILKQADHYMKWGGRTVAHTIANFFLMYSKYSLYLINLHHA